MNVAFIAPTDVVIRCMFGEPQQDDHVKKWRWAKFMGPGWTGSERTKAWYLANHGAAHVRN